MRFNDRSQAGKQLAERLAKYANHRDTIVLGLPRGGVPVAFEIARALSAPLDVFVVRKLGVPGSRELAMGAIATGGIRIINEPLVDELGVPQSVMDRVAAVQTHELERQEIVYRGYANRPDFRRQLVILVDDGIATGSTMRAAVAAIRKQEPARIVAAVPAASAAAASQISSSVDEFISLIIPQDFYAVGHWYRDFSEVTDAEVTFLLRQARRFPQSRNAIAGAASVPYRTANRKLGAGIRDLQLCCRPARWYHVAVTYKGR